MNVKILGLAVAGLLMVSSLPAAACGCGDDSHTTHVESMNLEAASSVDVDLAPRLGIQEGRFHLGAPLLVDAVIDEVAGGLVHLKTEDGARLTVSRGLPEVLLKPVGTAVNLALMVDGAEIVTRPTSVPFAGLFTESRVLALRTVMGPMWISESVFANQGIEVPASFQALLVDLARIGQDDLVDRDLHGSVRQRAAASADVRLVDQFHAERDDDVSLVLDRSDTF